MWMSVDKVSPESDAATFGRTTSVVGERGDVDNLGHFDTGTVYGADGGLASVAGSLYISFHFSQAQVVGYFSAILGGHLRCVGGVFLRTAETHLSGT